MKEPEYFAFDEYKVRKGKIQELHDLGIDPYPHHFTVTHSIDDILINYAEAEHLGSFEDAKEKRGPVVTLAGRLMLHRPMGKNIFSQIQEEGKKIQVLFNRDVVKILGYENDDPTPHKVIEKKFDLGDIIGVKGYLFKTQKNELTVFVHEAILLTKSLLPLPDKHSGLVDKETRYRKRWLDLIANQEVLDTFVKRSQILRLIREYYHQHDFLEVEIPTLERSYGGAQARPFVTHLYSLDMRMYMRIALEISLKKLIVGGMRRVFEMGKLFRNEGIDATHNPEFSMLESYAAYWDYQDVMKFTENLFVFVAKELFGTTKIGERKDRAGNVHTIDVKAPWIRMTMKESILHYAKIDVDQKSNEELRSFLLESGMDAMDVQKKPRGLLIQGVFEELVEKHLIQPHFILDHPIETTPLCKLHRDEKLAREGIVERFEAFVLGMEMCNAYTELNDPILQRKLLEEQDRLLKEGNGEASPLDEEFLEAISTGMPPCGGLGLGIDRFVMLFLNQSSIRDVIFFPMMRSFEHSEV